MENKQELNIKEIQVVSFEILKKIKQIFDENNWKYYLAYGTLIGSIRNEGFIPWDDDIDIWVPRPDYERFIEYAKKNKENLKPFELIHYSTNDKYVYPIARFSNSNYFIKYNNIKDYGLGIFVDIYPIDGIKLEDKKHLKQLRKMIKRINLLGNKKYIISKPWIKNIIKYPYYLTIRNNNLSNLLKKIDSLAHKYNYDDELWVDCTTWATEQISFPKKWIENKKEECFKKFNGTMFRVPYDYDNILTRQYGNYMQLPPENKRIPLHDYIAYRKD